MTTPNRTNLDLIEPLEARIAPARVFGVDTANHLISFDSATPGTLTAPVTITGLGSGEVVNAIDYRPFDGALFGVAISGASTPYTGTIYLIDPTTGAAAALGAPFSTTLGSKTGLDCDIAPETGIIRITNTSRLNLRVSSGDGQIVSTDTNITRATEPAGIAYGNSFSLSAGSTLYAIDYSTDALYRIGGENGTPSAATGVGTFVTALSAGSDLDTQDRIGFDIDTRIEGDFAYYTGSFSSLQRIQRVDLKTGQLTDLGKIGNGATAYLDIAVQPARYSFTDGKSFTYTDSDGDLVKVKTSAGTFSSSQFTWLTSADGSRRELRSFNGGSLLSFEGADLSFKVKGTTPGGDGRVNIGGIFTGTLNLGTVTVAGNLEALATGAGATDKFAIISLDVLSVGSLATDAYADYSILLINGKVGTVTIAGDLSNASFTAAGVDVTTIGGSIIGGVAESSGLVNIGSAKSFTVGGSVIGGAGKLSGVLAIGGRPSTVKIGGSILGGGDGLQSGFLSLVNSVGSVKLKGAVTGGFGEESGRVSAFIVDKLVIDGGITGGFRQKSGTVDLNNGAAPVFLVGGSITGNSGKDSGVLSLGTVQTNLTLAGSIVGGQGDGSGGLVVITAGQVDLLGSILGSILGSGHGGGAPFVADTRPNIAATIGKIIIKGRASGIASAGDSYAIEAEKIGKVTIAGRTLALNPMANDNLLIGVFADLRVRELILT